MWLSSHPFHYSLCFGSKFVVVVVEIGFMETRLYVSVNSKPDHPPDNFFDRRIPHPWARKEFKTPTPGAYTNELKPTSEAFFSIIHYKNMKK